MVPNGWEQTTISSISKTIMGFAFKSTDFVADGMPLIRMGNLYQNQLQLDRNPVFLPTNFAKEYERFVLRSGDLVMSMTGTMGKRDYGFTVQIPENTQDCLLNQRVMKFEEKSNSNRGFLKYLLKSEHVLTRLYSFPGGTKQANLSAKQVGEIPVLLPPLPEQRKIAQILSTWDRGIVTTEKLIDASKQQKKALMQQLLTGKKRLVDPETDKAFEGEWEEVKLESHINLLSGHAFKSSEFEKDSDYKLLRGINITRGSLRWGEEQTFSWTQLNGFEKYLLSVGDIVISMDGSLVGRNYALITENNHEPMLLVQRVARIRCKKTLDNNYLLQQIASDRFKAYVDAVKTVTAIPHISAKDIKHFIISMPPVKEQQKIASVLTTADKEIELLEAKLAHLKQEKKALMQQLLTGKRRVKVAETEVA